MQNNTSVEEDTELRDLVAQTLENRGILPKIRAQLRASVFSALEENSTTIITGNDDLTLFMKLPMAAIVLNLVREFLEVLQLDFTLSVFEPETKFGKEYTRIAKDALMKHFNVKIEDCKKPILYEILARIVSESGLHAKGDVKDEISANLESNLILNVPDSPDLNSTYVKKPVEQSSFLDNLHKPLEDNDENYDSIDEVLPSNKTSSSDRSVGEPPHEIKANIFGSPPACKADEKLRTLINHVENNQPGEDIDLLTFTPVKEVKTGDKSNSAADKNEEKTKPNSLSVLGDLPPLNAKTESKKNQMNEIKAIIDQGLDIDKSEPKSSSAPSSKDDQSQDTGRNKSLADKSDKSQNLLASEKSEKSETIDGDEFDEDDDNLSDLINSQASSDNQFTVDESISKTSNVGDHLESI